MDSNLERASREVSRKLQDGSAISLPPNVALSNRGIEGLQVVEYELDAQMTDSRLTLVLGLDPLDFRDAAFSILRDGTYEPVFSDMFMRLASVSNHAYDIGANIGYYSLLALKCNPEITVTSFEPNPMLWERFKVNADLNGVSKRARLEQVGVGEEASETTLYVPSTTGTGGGSLRDLHPLEGTRAQPTVRIVNPTTLDISQTPDLIKMDIEGAELSAIRGLLPLIRQGLPTIFVELLRKWMKPFNSHPMDVVSLLSKLGYEMFAIGEAQLWSVERIDGNTKETNFLFVHPTRDSHYRLVRHAAQNQRDF